MRIIKRRFGEHQVICEIRGGEMACEAVSGEEESVTTTGGETVKRMLTVEIITMIYSMRPRKRKEG